MSNLRHKASWKSSALAGVLAVGLALPVTGFLTAANAADNTRHNGNRVVYGHITTRAEGVRDPQRQPDYGHRATYKRGANTSSQQRDSFYSLDHFPQSGNAGSPY